MTPPTGRQPATAAPSAPSVRRHLLLSAAGSPPEAGGNLNFDLPGLHVVRAAQAPSAANPAPPTVGPVPHLGERGPAVRPGPRPGLNPDLRDPVLERASVQRKAELHAFERRCWWLVGLAPVAALLLLVQEAAWLTLAGYAAVAVGNRRG